MLADKVVDLTGADSSGISIEETDDGKTRVQVARERRRIRAYVGATMLRYNSPCGTVLDTNATQLMRVPERHYPFPQQPHKPIEEVLLVPFYSGKRPAGAGMGDHAPQKQAVRQRGPARHHEPLPIRRGRRPEFAQSGPAKA